MKLFFSSIFAATLLASAAGLIGFGLSAGFTLATQVFDPALATDPAPDDE